MHINNLIESIDHFGINLYDFFDLKESTENLDEAGKNIIKKLKILIR